MKIRVISAAIALTIIVPVYIVGGLMLSILAGLIGILGYKEIITLKQSHHPLPLIVVILGLFSLLLLIFANYDGYILVFGVSYQAIIFMLLALLIPTLFFKNDEVYTTQDALYLIGFILLLGVTLNGLLLLRSMNILLLVYLFLISALNDTFAMIFGKLIGRHKLCPKISPNKTIEGSVAGFILGTIVAALFYYNLIGQLSITKVIILTMLLSALGQIGDLLFSKIKRENGIKDFSHIMPGHGGVLDRIDSISFVLIAFIMILRFL